MRVVIGADHGGFSLKGPVAEEIRRLGHDVVDVGATSTIRPTTTRTSQWPWP